MKTEIKQTPKKGRGIFATAEISPGEIIETCQLILMDLNEVRGVLEGYIFQYKKNVAAVALGNGSLYNHSDKPNAEFYFNFQKKVLIFRALKKIAANSEITVNYGYTASEKKQFSIKS
jgi:SET domain-containing protein